jgi:hypothetical protein
MRDASTRPVIWRGDEIAGKVPVPLAQYHALLPASRLSFRDNLPGHKTVEGSFPQPGSKQKPGPAESSLYLKRTIPIFMLMTETRYAARRATVEDLPQLIPLWKLEQLPTDDLERRFTEFQVVSDEAGQVLGTIGLQINGADGLLHSESMARPELGDQLRELLWKRLQAMVHNHALERLWTQMNVPFWRAKGFARAPGEQLAALPPAFKSNERDWHLLTLRTPDANAAIEREFGRLKAMQAEEKAKMEAFVAWMKRAAVVALLFLMLVGAVAVIVLRFAPQIFRQR